MMLLGAEFPAYYLPAYCLQAYHLSIDIYKNKRMTLNHSSCKLSDLSPQEEYVSNYAKTVLKIGVHRMSIDNRCTLHHNVILLKDYDEKKIFYQHRFSKLG